MTWEIIATWVMLAITVGGVVFAMGKQSQKIENQQTQIADLKLELNGQKELPIKLATLETDMKYVIEQLREVKTLLQLKVGN